MSEDRMEGANADRIEQLEEALLCIKQWAEAYPVDVFRPVDLKHAQRALESEGIDMGALHAGWARHLLEGIAGIASRALG